ncbi:cation-transporting P-type ATPase [Rarobacter faecitabidus]|uniref:P-type E1-E2 ATPase n=1 Tax=Rarobacter faecitabidus TaxID=13243 RepID=A0A542ZVC9_RARFA|nr:HAD-IC family P-type ATPase [Rarobacter faecitabidus]TQL64318.1 P-type E1-E2 ATPase [Rarobacter faecitabidus]
MNLPTDTLTPADIGSEPDPRIAGAFALDVTEVMAALDSSTAGLAKVEAERRLTAGRNEIPAPKPQPAWRLFLKHFDDVLIYILLAAGVLKAIMGDWVDASVVLAVAIINAIIGFVQEGKAASALDAIRGMMTVGAQVQRDGQWESIDAAELVPGDIVRVGAGDRVPADIRLVDEANLRVDEAALTGESVAAEKSSDPVDADAGVGDRDSMIFSGTIVAAGQGVGVVTETGASTQIGRIQSMVAQAGGESLETPLGRQLAAFGKLLSIIILIVAAVQLIVGRLVHDFPREDLISAAIGFAVAAIPEGLPALVTITLALGVQQMARRKAITRNLPSVETLGAVTTICSDKTGTLTKNEMTVRAIEVAGASYDVSGTGYDPAGAITIDGAEAVGDQLTEAIATFALCNDAIVREVAVDGGQPRWTLIGEPTEGAVAALALKAGIDLAGERVATFPFSSEHKYMAVIVRDAPVLTPSGNGARLLVKGAPDRVLDRCVTQRGAGGAAEPLDAERWTAVIDHLSGQGLRVLAAASRPADQGEDEVSADTIGTELTLIGIIGIVDPPRPEAIAAIKTCHEAGIAVKMITGDHVGTARAIAEEMGIVGSDDAVQVLTGAELEAMPQGRLEKLAPQVDVYARTSPEHKIRIVRALQAGGQVVSMTGDGVNDAPALTRADVGVAMGIKGTEATKEAADIVLADDNFATIEGAVEEGRRIYDNILKSVLFLLPTNGAQALVMLIAVLMGWALPLDPVQILWVNMVTAVTLSLTLAYEPAEDGIMARPPRKVGGSLVDGRAMRQIAFVSVLIGAATLAAFKLATDAGLDNAVAQTVAVNTLTFGQVAYLFNCRYRYASSIRLSVFEGNRVLWISLGALIALQLVFIYFPPMHTLFHSSALGVRGWVSPLIAAIGIFLAVEVWKALGRLTQRRSIASRATAGS